MEKVLTVFGSLVILAGLGFAWHNWHSGFHDNLDRIRACENEVVTEYRDNNLDWREFWTPKNLHEYCAKEMK